MMDNTILFCIFNYRIDEGARRWHSLLSPYFKTVVLDSGNNKKCEDFIQFPNIYYSGLFNEAKKMTEEGGYRWLGIITSDVVIDDKNAAKLIKKIQWLFTTQNIGIYSIIGDKSGHSNTYQYTTIGNETFRYIEGFFQIVRSEIIKEQPYVDTKVNLYGHGIDYISCFISNKMNYINFVDEDIDIFHPRDKGYDRTEAIKQQKCYAKLLKERYFPDYIVMAKPFKCRQDNIDGVGRIKYINKCLYNSDKLVVESKKKHPIILSFTTWKDRVVYLKKFVDNIVKSSLEFDAIVLWVSSDEIKKEDIPQSVYDKISVCWVDKNLKSFKKFLSIQQYPEAYNITVDDDMLYDSDILKELYGFCIQHIDSTICCYYSEICNSKGQPWAAVDKDYTNTKWLSTGCCVFPPNTFPQEAFDYFYDIMSSEKLMSDECYLMPFLVKNNIAIDSVLDKGNINNLTKRAPNIEGSQRSALHIKFYGDKSGDLISKIKYNKKNDLMKRIISRLPFEYYAAFKLKFPNFEGNPPEELKNPLINKICELDTGYILPIHSDNERIIVSLTSWKKRIENVSVVLESILKNTKLPDLIVINLSVLEFPNKEFDLPESLNRLIKSDICPIEIIWLRNNTKVWKKIIPTILKYPDDCIIGIDDDFIYPKDFIETLYGYHIQHPEVGVSGNKIFLVKKHKAHCGCASLVKKSLFGDSFSLLSDIMLESFSDDVFYTFAAVKNNCSYEYCGKMFSHNMETYNEVEGYSSTSKIGDTNVLWQEIYEPYFRDKNIEKHNEPTKCTFIDDTVCADNLDIEYNYSLWEKIKKREDACVFIPYEFKKPANNSLYTPIYISENVKWKFLDSRFEDETKVPESVYFFGDVAITYCVWKNFDMSEIKYIGQLKSDNAFKETANFDKIFRKFDIITNTPVVYKGYSVSDMYGNMYNGEDLRKLGEVLCKKYPDYSIDYDKCILKNCFLFSAGCFVMRKKDYIEWCAFVFDVMAEYRESYIDYNNKSVLKKYVQSCVMKFPDNKYRVKDIDIQMMIGKHLSDILFTLWVRRKFPINKIYMFG